MRFYTEHSKIDLESIRSVEDDARKNTITRIKSWSFKVVIVFLNVIEEWMIFKA